MPLQAYMNGFTAEAVQKMEAMNFPVRCAPIWRGFCL